MLYSTNVVTGLTESLKLRDTVQTQPSLRFELICSLADNIFQQARLPSFPERERQDIEERSRGWLSEVMTRLKESKLKHFTAFLRMTPRNQFI